MAEEVKRGTFEVPEHDDLWEKANKFMKETDDLLDEHVENKSACKAVIRKARRQQAMILHRARQEEDNEVVYLLRGYMKSIGKMEWELRGRGY